MHKLETNQEQFKKRIDNSVKDIFEDCNLSAVQGYTYRYKCIDRDIYHDVISELKKAGISKYPGSQVDWNRDYVEIKLTW